MICLIYIWLSILFRDMNVDLLSVMVFKPLNSQLSLQKCLFVLCLLPVWLWPAFTVRDIKIMQIGSLE